MIILINNINVTLDSSNDFVSFLWWSFQSLILYNEMNKYSIFKMKIEKSIEVLDLFRSYKRSIPLKEGWCISIFSIIFVFFYAWDTFKRHEVISSDLCPLNCRKNDFSLMHVKFLKKSCSTISSYFLEGEVSYLIFSRMSSSWTGSEDSGNNYFFEQGYSIRKIIVIVSFILCAILYE